MSFFFFSSRRRHTRCGRDWSSDVCSSDLRRMLQRHNHGCGGRFSDAEITVNRVRIEVDRVARFDAVGDLAMPDIERSRQQIKKLAAAVLMRAGHAAFLDWRRLRAVALELPAGHLIPQALEEVRGVVATGL